MEKSEDRLRDLREQIAWYLERIKNADTLHMILTMVNRIYIGKRI